jgi:lambda family phage tail tape measure protein
MAGQTYNIDLQATDSTGSMKQRTKDAKEHNQELTKTQRLLQEQSKPTRGVASEYGTMRAIGSGTGAAARDFAKESQGLSGLVRLYAIYAANIFAASAAFRALSSAMDTTNMVKGMDQLGAYSGIALGSLAKQLVGVTDNAISMREAMEATAQATSAGLTNKQLLDIGKVAKSASQALGRDLGDSISRLSRGIVKLEPELLDELGLFTKIGPATEKYALSIGKSAASLTDFEKRQAFANAVIKEGIDKFSSLNLDANPYTKLSATLANVAQSGLELVNKVLTPLTSILSSSPTTLAVVIAGFAAMLVKQAIPAIGEYRASLMAAQEASASQAARRNVQLQAGLKKEVDMRIAAADAAAEKEYATFETASSRLQAARDAASKKTLKGSKAEGYAISQMDLHEITPEKLATLKELGKGTSTMAGNYRELAASVENYNTANQKYQSVKEQELAKLNNEASFITTKGRLQRIANQENLAFRSSEIKADAAYIASTEGVRAAVSKSFADIRAAMKGPSTREITFEALDDSGKKVIKTMDVIIPKMGMLRGIMTGVAASIAITGAAIGTMLSFLAPWLQLIGLVTAGFGLLDGWLSKASVQMADFESSMTSTKEATKTLKDSIDLIYRKDNSQVFSIQSLDAQAKALANIGDNLDTLINKANSATVAVGKSGWDTFKDNLFSLFGGGIKNNFAKAFQEQLGSVIDSVDASYLSKKLISDIGTILDVTDPIQNLDKLKNKLQSLDPASTIVLKLKNALKEFSRETNNASEAQTKFRDAFKKSEETFQGLMKTITIDDPFSKWLLDSLVSISSLDVAIKGDINESIGNLVDLTSKLSKNPIFGPGAQSDMSKYKDSLISINEEMGVQAKKSKDLETQRDLLNQKLKDAQKSAVDSGATYVHATGTYENLDSTSTAKIAELQKDLQGINRGILEAGGRLIAAQERGKDIAQEIQKRIPSGVETLTTMLATQIGVALNKGSTLYLQGIYSKLDIVPEFVKRTAELKIKEIEQSLALTKALMSFEATTRELEINRKIDRAKDNYQEATATLANRTILNDPFGTTGSNALKKQTQAETDLKAAEKEQEIFLKIKKNPQAGTLALAGAGLSPESTRGMAEFAAQRAGGMAKLNEGARRIADENLQKELDFSSKTFDLQIKNKRLEGERLANKLESLNTSKTNNLISEDEFNKQKDNLNTLKDKNDFDIKSLEISKESAAWNILGNSLEKEGIKNKSDSVVQDGKKAKIAGEELTTKAQINANESKANKDQAIADAASERSIKKRFELETQRLNTAERLRAIQNTTDTTDLQFGKDILQNLFDRGKISEDQFTTLTKQATVNGYVLEYNQKSAEIEAKRANDQRDLLETVRQNGGVWKDIDTQRKNDIDLIAGKEENSTKRSMDQKLMLAEMDDNLSERGKKYAQVFSGVIDSFINGIEQFAKTGKMSFGDMVSQMIIDLAKLEIKMKLFQVLQSAGGMTGFMTNFLGLSGMTVPKVTPSITPTTSGGGNYLEAASGYAFNSPGMMKFADGGVFANSVVTSPTLFKFAQGGKMGLMGEAGPEAIMPLKRGPDGNLGVRGGNSNPVNVVVNNFGSEKATTKKTVDSRGQTQIEVTIGNMVASQLNSTGSQIQQTMHTTYGQEPTLPRR